MIQRLNVTAQCSTLSLGQVGFNLLRELYKRKVQVCFFPRQFDLSPFRVDTGFGQWLERAANTRYAKLDRKVPTLNVWHIAESEKRISDKQVTLSFHETDSPTEAEINIVNQQDHTFFTSNWTVDSFKTYGAPNVSFVPLGLDEDFVPAPRRMIAEDVTHWILVGKHEGRKNTELIIRTWMKRFGGNRQHQLTLCIFNPFYQKRQLPNGQIEGFDMNDVYASIFRSGKPHNVNIMPPLKTNAEMLSLYQSADIDLSGFSSSEGWGIPAHTCTALGKWSIVTNCSAHKDWATKENSILVDPVAGPAGMREVYDNVFFQKGAPFSQGNIYAFTAEQLDEAMSRAEKIAKTPNPAGEALRTQHTYSKTLDTILEKLGD